MGLSKVNFSFLIFDTLSKAIYKPLEPSASIAVFCVVTQNPFFKKKKIKTRKAWWLDNRFDEMERLQSSNIHTMDRQYAAFYRVGEKSVHCSGLS